MGFVSAAESAGGDTDNGDVGDTHYFGVRNGDAHDNGFDDNGDCRHGFDDSDNAGGVAAGADAAVLVRDLALRLRCFLHAMI